MMYSDARELMWCENLTKSTYKVLAGGCDDIKIYTLYGRSIDLDT